MGDGPTKQKRAHLRTEIAVWARRGERGIDVENLWLPAPLGAQDYASGPQYAFTERIILPN
jgi:hypothetical protein